MVISNSFEYLKTMTSRTDWLGFGFEDESHLLPLNLQETEVPEVNHVAGGDDQLPL